MEARYFRLVPLILIISFYFYDSYDYLIICLLINCCITGGGGCRSDQHGYMSFSMITSYILYLVNI
ncbi:hypothetical protein T492DRAFT_939352 [Pavlovales sp. CCMP2436]|nr:hypothetical protein T492DRAFT_939352 [Pavlovales sp. CCMP2436]